MRSTDATPQRHGISHRDWCGRIQVDEFYEGDEHSGDWQQLPRYVSTVSQPEFFLG